jgi:hypothetical protein
MEGARRLTRERGHPPTTWTLTLLWEDGNKQVHGVPPVRSLKGLVRWAREMRHTRLPTWMFVAGRLNYRGAGVELPHIVVLLAGSERAVMLRAEIDSDGNPSPTRVDVDPDPRLLGPLAQLGR